MDDDDYDITTSKIRARMAEAQDMMRRQERADNAKSKLCDGIQSHKGKVDGLKASVAELEYSNPRLYDYIRRLEYVQSGIWCDACANAKQIHHDIGDDYTASSVINNDTTDTKKSPLELFRERTRRVDKPVMTRASACDLQASTVTGLPVTSNLVTATPVATKTLEICGVSDTIPIGTVFPSSADTVSSLIQSTIEDLVRRVTALEQAAGKCVDNGKCAERNHDDVITTNYNPPPQPRASVRDIIGFGLNSTPVHSTTPNAFAATPFTLPTITDMPCAADLLADEDIFTQKSSKSTK